MRKINAYYMEQQIVALNKLVEKTGIKFAEHLRRAVDLYLAEMRKQGMDDADLQVSAQSDKEAKLHS